MSSCGRGRALELLVELRSIRFKISDMRSSPATMASKDLGHVGERVGRVRKDTTGSRSPDGGVVGEWKVSPFLRDKPGRGDPSWTIREEASEGGAVVI